MTCKLLYFYVLEILLSGGVIVRGVFVLGGNCPGGNCPGVIVRGVIVRGVIVLEPVEDSPQTSHHTAGLILKAMCLASHPTGQ